MPEITFETYTYDGNVQEVALPAVWEVCETCNGEGNLPMRGISPTGDGSWTGSEMADFYSDDADFAAEYFSGGYVEPCTDCRGLRVVAAPDPEADPALLAAYDEWLQAEYDAAACARAEQRAGC